MNHQSEFGHGSAWFRKGIFKTHVSKEGYAIGFCVIPQRPIRGLEGGGSIMSMNPVRSPVLLTAIAVIPT